MLQYEKPDVERISFLSLQNTASVTEPTLRDSVTVTSMPEPSEGVEDWYD